MNFVYEINKKWLFSGDTLYPGPIYLHLKESDIGEYKKSFVKKIKQRIQEKAQHIFTSSGEFLRQVHGGK